MISTLLACTVWARPAQAPGGACGAPSYKVAYRYSEGTKEVAIAVSIDPRDVTLHNLLALACQFRADFPDAETIGVNIFNNYEAGRKADVHGVEEGGGQRRYRAAFIAYYHLDRPKGKDVLTLVGDPRHPCGNDIDINLKNRSAGFVPCK